ncbi:hypothetical protein LTSEINV_2878 [Salmonella enterica subsp. enterica serovar Inverness str. R8-3668]|uniref:Uncharacterized protein n=1 Tax=Salmonella enterica subsp. enterica serovar Inverness str. R8-3668 TaxID=913075 RepID=G5NDY6_SALET|nr:hypothetical protein LTSEINV_2878 [Salmonella enterica subsp. enterica serovar Inverness str. R8-3668]
MPEHSRKPACELRAGFFVPAGLRAGFFVPAITLFIIANYLPEM